MDIREASMKLEKKWGKRPLCVLACSGYSDEHWQLYHPDSVTSSAISILPPMPSYVLGLDGVLERHPDAPSST